MDIFKIGDICISTHWMSKNIPVVITGIGGDSDVYWVKRKDGQSWNSIYCFANQIEDVGMEQKFNACYLKLFEARNPKVYGIVKFCKTYY